MQNEKPAAEEQPEGTEPKAVANNDRERAILAANPMMHWSDVMM